MRTVIMKTSNTSNNQTYFPWMPKGADSQFSPNYDLTALNPSTGAVPPYHLYENQTTIDEQNFKQIIFEVNDFNDLAGRTQSDGDLRTTLVPHKLVLFQKAEQHAYRLMITGNPFTDTNDFQLWIVGAKVAYTSPPILNTTLSIEPPKSVNKYADEDYQVLVNSTTSFDPVTGKNYTLQFAQKNFYNLIHDNIVNDANLLPDLEELYGVDISSSSSTSQASGSITAPLIVDPMINSIGAFNTSFYKSIATSFMVMQGANYYEQNQNNLSNTVKAPAKSFLSRLDKNKAIYDLTKGLARLLIV